MLFPKNTRITNASLEKLREFLQDIFKKPPYNNGIGKKELKVISSSENEPTGLYIRVHKLGNREPWCMGDGTLSFDEYEIRFLLDVVVSDTDQKGPDKQGPKLTIKTPNEETPSKLGDNGEISSNVCDTLTTIFSYSSEWRQKLSELGIHNARLVDERETYQGTDYRNPMRLVFNAYVQT